MLLGFLFLGAYSCCLLQSFYCKTLLSLIKICIAIKRIYPDASGPSGLGILISNKQLAISNEH